MSSPFPYLSSTDAPCSRLGGLVPPSPKWRPHTQGPRQGEGPLVCYDVRNMDCTVHGIGASKFPLEQQENLNIELLREVKHIF
jgi:hypothetical protein